MRDVSVFDDDAFGRVVPFAFVVDQGAGADGVENAGGGGRDGFGAMLVTAAGAFSGVAFE